MSMFEKNKLPHSAGADVSGEGLEPNFYAAKKGIGAWLVTLDHKRIGLMYLVAIMFFFLIGGLLALSVRLELLNGAPSFFGVDAGAQLAKLGDKATLYDTVSLTVADIFQGILGAVGFDVTQAGGNLYNKAFTLHGAVMVFLVIIPSIPASLGNFLLPLMLGVKDVAFPKLNLLSFYIYVVGALILVFSIISGSFDTGWTFYTPFSSQDSSGAVIPAVFGAFVLGFSSILTGVNFITTIHKMRAPGMTWNRLPLFVWAQYATSVIQVLATPVLAITLCLLIAERAMGLGIFTPSLGGDAVLFQHFFWFYSHPAVYIMILPAFGVISEIVSVHSKRHIFGYNAIAASSVAIAVIGFLVWGHHMFVSGQSGVMSVVFSFLTFLVAIPTAIKVFSWVATMYKGKITLNTPMVYGLCFLFLFTIGGLTGLFLGALNTDLHLHDTYFVVAHFHYVMMGGTLVAFVGAIFHWWPKMTGKMYNEFFGKLSAWLVFIGFNLTFFCQFVAGSRGAPRRYWTHPEAYDTWHYWSSIGSFILAVGLFLALFVMIHSLLKGKKAPKNPWGAQSLEWKTATPPIEHNFHGQVICEKGPYDFPEAEKGV